MIELTKETGGLLARFAGRDDADESDQGRTRWRSGGRAFRARLTAAVRGTGPWRDARFVTRRCSPPAEEADIHVSSEIQRTSPARAIIAPLLVVACSQSGEQQCS